MDPFLIIAIIVGTIFILNVLSNLRMQKKEIEQLKADLDNALIKNKELEDQIEVMDMEMDLLEDIYKSRLKDIAKDETDKKPIQFTF